MSWNAPPPAYQGYWQGAPEWQQAAPEWQQAPPGSWQQPTFQHPSVDWHNQPSQAWGPAPVAVPSQPEHSFQSAPPPPRPQPPAPAPTAPAPAPVPSVAYTSVAVPKAQPVRPAAAANKTAAEGNKTAAWPSSLRAYVERAFAVPQLDRSKLQSELANVINAAKQKGDLWSRDWDRYPLPLSEPEPSKDSKTQPVSFALNKSTRLKASLAVERHSPLHIRATPENLETAKSELSHVLDTLEPIQKKSKQQSPKQLPIAKGNMEPKLSKKQRKAQQKALNQSRKQWNSQFHAEDEDDWKAAERSRRFGDGTTPGAVQWHRQENLRMDLGYSDAVEGNDVIGSGPAIRGVCQNIEKSYFRLTSKPDPSSVRPEPVLQKALDRLVQMIRSGDRRCNYIYATDQFKGMRQDCTVQHIQSELSARIYEAHARCAMENGDIGEFNQCQGQLQQHYEAGISGCKHEFLAYRILYQAVHADKGHVALLTCLQSISSEDARHPYVMHALKVREAIALTDCTQVSRLYSEAPNMGQALLDIVVPKVRLIGLKMFVKAFLPDLPVQAIAERLGYVLPIGRDFKAPPVAPDSALPGCSVAAYKGRHAAEVDYNYGLKCCLAWVTSCGAVLTGPQGGAVNCKASQGQLHKPAEAKSVGPDLAIEDFLSRTLM